MSITVKDCLSLPSLSMAKVLGGHGGLDCIVNSISVLEFDFTSLDPYTPNELTITAFYLVKDDIEAQVEAIRVSKLAGIVGIVLFYSEVVLQGIDKRVIEAANEVNLPLILLPGSDLGLKYSDVIRDVSEAIILDAKSKNTYVKDTIDRISQMQFQKRTVDNVLGLLSEYNRCSIAICDAKKNILWYSFWPNGCIFNIENEIQDVNNTIGNHYTFHDKNNVPLTLYFMKPYHHLSASRIAESAEILQLFSSIWDVSMGVTKREGIITSILEGKQSIYERESSAYNIDLSKYKTIMLFSKSERYPEVKGIMNRYDSTALLDYYKNTLVCMSTLDNKDLMWLSLIQELDEVCDDNFYYICSSNLVENAKRFYIEYYKSKDSVSGVFPSLKIIDYNIIRFVSRCREIINQKGKEWRYYNSLLAPVKNSDSSLMLTLQTFLFDADSSVMKTSSILFVHRNTVKYRLDIIKSILGFDFEKMPFFNDVYTAAAIDRIETNNNKEGK